MTCAGDSSAVEHLSDKQKVAARYGNAVTRMVRIPLPRFHHDKLGQPDDPYVERWYVEGRFGSIRIHHWRCSDDQRAFHDHPWQFLSMVLKGGYTDRSPVRTLVCSVCGRSDLTWNHLCPEHGWVDVKEVDQERLDHLHAGSVRLRQAEHKHTVVVDPGGAWTLLVTGPEVRQWGFWVKGRFRKRNRYFYDHGHHVCDR